MVFMVICDQNTAFWPTLKAPNPVHASRNTSPIVKYGSGNIMIWGYVLSAGTGELFKIEGRMMVNKFYTILQENLL